MSPLLFLAALLAPALAAETPRAFVDRLYASYGDPDFSPFRKPKRIFAPAFVAALDKDRRLHPDEVGFVDADPLCQCQDTGGMEAKVGAVSETGQGRAEAAVRLSFGPADVREISLKLVRTRSGWRVTDVASADEPSFLADLQASNRKP
jgi:hypothetical protein